MDQDPVSTTLMEGQVIKVQSSVTVDAVTSSVPMALLQGQVSITLMI